MNNNYKKIKWIKSDKVFEIQKTEFYKQFMEEFFKNSKKYIKNAETFNKNDITDEDYNRLYRFTQSIQKSSFAFLAAMEWTLISSYFYATIEKDDDSKPKREHFDHISNMTLGELFKAILLKKRKLKRDEIKCYICCKKEEIKTHPPYDINKRKQKFLEHLNKTKVFNEKIEIDAFKSKAITGFRNKIMHHKFLFGLSATPDSKKDKFIPSFFEDYVNIFNSYEQTRHKLYILKNYSEWYSESSGNVKKDKVSKYVFEICKKYFFLEDKTVMNFCNIITQIPSCKFQQKILGEVVELKKKKDKN